MSLISITIEGTTYQADTQIVAERNLLEEREFGQVTILSERSARFEVYDRVDIDINGQIEQYLVQSDDVVKYRDDIYEHNVTLIENVAKFDGFIPADRSFTRVPSQNLRDILNVYKRELKHYHNIEIDFDANAVWADVLMPQKEFIGLSFSVILSDLFRRINAHAKVERQDDVWFIFPQFYSERNNPIGNDVAESVLNRMQNTDYATKIKTQVKNGIFEDYDQVWFPSSNGSVLPKSSSPQVIESNLRYELDSPIIEITKALVTDVEIILQKVDEDEAASETFLAGGFLNQDYEYEAAEEVEFIDTIDISDYVVTKQEWDVLPTIQDIQDGQKFRSDNNRNYVYYQIGSPFVENLFASNTHNVFLFFEGNTSYLINAINRVLYRDYVENGEWDVAKLKTIVRTDDVPMRFQYIRQRNLDLAHSRQHIGQMNESTFLHNQRDSYVDISRYLNNMKGVSNRLGNQAKDKSKTFDIDEQPYQVGDFDNEGKVVVRVKNTYTNNYILCEYTLTENFANIFGGQISAEPSPFTINRKIATTNVIVEDFLEVSKERKSDTSRLTSEARQTALKVLNNDTSNVDSIHFGLFRPILGVGREEETDGIIMPVMKGEGGNTMMFHVYFDDVQRAGQKFTANFATPIAYTYIASDRVGEPGTLNDYFLFFTKEISVNDNGEYPLNNDYELFADNALTETNLFEPIDLDINSAFAQTYHVHAVSDDKDIIVGNAFTKYNFLHGRNSTESKQIKFYKSDKPFTIYDDTIRDYDVETTAINANLDVFNQSLLLTTSEVIDYYAITLDDEILIADNEGLIVGNDKTLYFNFLKNVEKTESNQLVAPLFRQASVSDTTIDATFFNFNDEEVDMTITLNRVNDIETVTFEGVNAKSSRTVSFDNLDYATTYILKAQNLASNASLKTDSITTRQRVETALKPVLKPSVTQIRRTSTSVEFEFTNPNDFEVDIRAYINDELLTQFTERTFNLTLDANQQTVRASIDALEEDGYYEIAFDAIYNTEFPFVASDKTDEFILFSAKPELPIVSLIDDSDTTTSQFKMRYTASSQNIDDVRLYVSVNEQPFEEIDALTPGGFVDVIYNEQDLGVQLPPASNIPIRVYHEYVSIGLPSDVQDRVSGLTRPVAPTFEVLELTPYESVIRVFNSSQNVADFVRLNIDSLNISTNVPSGNFYELSFDDLVPNTSFSYDAFVTYAGQLDSATTTISFTTLDGPPASPSFDRIESATSETEIKVRFINDDPRSVQMFGGFLGQQDEPIDSNVAGNGFTDKTFTDLKPGSRYDFTARARIGTQFGPQSTFTTYTKPARPQAQLVGVDANSASYRLFNGGNDYAVDVYANGNLVGTVQSGDFIEYTRTGLSEETNYTDTFFNRFEGMDSENETESYRTLGTPLAPVISVSSSTTNSIRPLIENNNTRSMNVFANVAGNTLLQVGTVSGDSEIVGFTYQDDLLDANRSVSYTAQFKDAQFSQYQNSTTTTLYTSPLQATNIQVDQTTTGGPEYVAVQISFFNPNDSFGPNLDAFVTIEQGGFRETVTLTNIDSELTNVANFSNLQGLDIDDFTVIVTIVNPTSRSSNSIVYNV